jgi:outer membrane protein assembly factor BamB
MDKKTEILLLKQKTMRQAAATTTAAPPAPAAPQAAMAVAPVGVAEAVADWWMYHGDPAHSGYVSDSNIRSDNVAQSLKLKYSIQLGGSVLSVPAIVDGYVYVGVANYLRAAGGNGGAFFKIDIDEDRVAAGQPVGTAGQIVSTFHWNLGNDEPDSHHFTGMGCTPAIANGRVYFSAFNGKFYCLEQDSLELIWVIDLRNADPAHNQPVTNNKGVDFGYPPAAGWSSPVLSADGKRVYVSIGEGENPFLYSFVFCLDSDSGNVIWIYCTNKFEDGADNRPNVLPAETIKLLPEELPSMFSTFEGDPVVMGCSVWGSIAYDEELNRIYCSTGNPQPEQDSSGKPIELPSPGYGDGLLSLDAESGEFRGFFQVPPDSNYRPSDIDVDIGSSPTIFSRQSDGRRVVSMSCKNGSFFVLDADTLKLVNRRQLLPYYNDGTQIPSVDPHVDLTVSSSDDPQPQNEAEYRALKNKQSNETPAENFSGPFATAAVYPGAGDVSQRIFIGMGGPNYHDVSPGIDYTSTPFMRAVDANSLEDVWPMDENDPQRYKNAMPPMYTTAAEVGLSSPAVANDVVFCTTTKISIYGFRADDGTLLWQDDLGMQTDGYHGGYGYCMGPAIWKDFVVAGALIFGRDGGILNVYKLEPQK